MSVVTVPGKLVVEGTKAIRKTPTVRREGVGLRTVVRGTGEGGGGGQRQKNQDINTFQVQDHWGVAVFYLDSPNSKYYQRHSRTERDLRHRGSRLGRFRGS